MLSKWTLVKLLWTSTTKTAADFQKLVDNSNVTWAKNTNTTGIDKINLSMFLKQKKVRRFSSTSFEYFQLGLSRTAAWGSRCRLIHFYCKASKGCTSYSQQTQATRRTRFVYFNNYRLSCATVNNLFCNTVLWYYSCKLLKFRPCNGFLGKSIYFSMDQYLNSYNRH